MSYSINNKTQCTACGYDILFSMGYSTVLSTQGLLHDLVKRHKECCGITYTLKHEYRYTITSEIIYKTGWYAIKKIKSGASGEEYAHPARLHSDGEWYSFYRDEHIDIEDYEILKPLNVGVE